tara:strand:+ start:336 stop:527 length:192 start_codon:yes stop_codon:yes gene_type:complete
MTKSNATFASLLALTIEIARAQDCSLTEAATTLSAQAGTLAIREVFDAISSAVALHADVAVTL